MATSRDRHAEIFIDILPAVAGRIARTIVPVRADVALRPTGQAEMRWAVRQ
jgi:hypothetical protein